jgi:hypothetical protein
MWPQSSYIFLYFFTNTQEICLMVDNLTLYSGNTN